MPWSKMPKSVKSSVGKNKKKQHTWMSTYESARAQGHSKESAAKIAHSVINKENLGDSEMKLSKIFSEVMLSESDVLKFSPELKSILIQEIPMLIKNINNDLRSDKYTTLSKQLEVLSQKAGQAKQILDQTLQSQNGKIQNKDQNAQPGITNPKAFSIRDQDL